MGGDCTNALTGKPRWQVAAAALVGFSLTRFHDFANLYTPKGNPDLFGAFFI